MTDETRQPLTVDVILSQAMEKTGTDTPTDLLRWVFDAVDRLAALEATPTPLLMVDTAGRITIRNDVTIRGLAQIIDALQNMRVAGAA
jgi:hypothetical protein